MYSVSADYIAVTNWMTNLLAPIIKCILLELGQDD